PRPSAACAARPCTSARTPLRPMQRCSGESTSEQAGTMPLQNADIAAIFGEIADLLEIQGANPFRVRAYRNAARSVSELGKSIPEMIGHDESLKTIRGIGDDLARKLREISATGKCA